VKFNGYVVATTRRSSLECLVQAARHIPVVVGGDNILLPNHAVYIHLWNKEVLAHIEVHVTRNDSLSEKEWSINLCSAYSTETIHIRTVSHMLDNLVRIL
jgi:hypothetical protein